MRELDYRHRFNHEPKAYKTNRTLFCNFEFYIDKRAYVPNPETELLAYYAITNVIKRNLREGIIFDVGTGCGNIAVTIARHFPKAQIFATEISKEALEVAAENVKKHKVKNITLINTDLIKKIKVKPDLVIADLPWGSDEYLLESNTKEALKYMPDVAIFAPNGLIGAYVRLLNQIRKKKWATTVLIETGTMEKTIIKKNLNRNKKFDHIKFPNSTFDYSICKFKL